MAGGELADRALLGEVPVDRAAGPVHQPLQLGEQRHLAQDVLGGAAAGHAAEQRTQAERVAAGRVAPAALAAVGIAVAGEAEAERDVTHASTVDARVPAGGRVRRGLTARCGVLPRACERPGSQLGDLLSPVVTRRIAVLTTGGVLLVLFGVLGTTLPVPYVAQVPGPTYNTLGDIDGEPIISVEGRERNEVEGNLNLTTVGVGRDGLSLVQAVRGWFDDEVAVVPEESVYPPDRTVEETRQANRRAFLTSEQAAESVALGHLGYPEKVVVRGLTEDSPSEGAPRGRRRPRVGGRAADAGLRRPGVGARLDPARTRRCPSPTPGWAAPAPRR